jgi:hypothetical protein
MGWPTESVFVASWNLLQQILTKRVKSVDNKKGLYFIVLIKIFLHFFVGMCFYFPIYILNNTNFLAFSFYFIFCSTEIIFYLEWAVLER